MKKAKKIKTFDRPDGKPVGIVREYCSGKPGWYRCNHIDIGTGSREGQAPAILAAECGHEFYCNAWEHRCEGQGCNHPTPYKYCAPCHFENRQPDDEMIGILGM